MAEDVLILNTSNLRTGHEVEAHAPTCKHVAKYERHPFFDGGTVASYATAQAIFNDYNVDFYMEGGDLDCWPVAVFPCTGLVGKTTTVSTWKDAD